MSLLANEDVSARIALADNKILVRRALSTGGFPTLAERIEKHGGDLAYFLDLGGTNS
jgi:hypothetical protein